MLQLTRSNDTTLTLVSDDENAELAAIQDALESVAPHLLDAYEGTELDGGVLRFDVGRDDWQALQEVLESQPMHDAVNSEELDQMVETIDKELES